MQHDVSFGSRKHHLRYQWVSLDMNEQRTEMDLVGYQWATFCQVRSAEGHPAID